jgi:hypothetical protein
MRAGYLVLLAGTLALGCTMDRPTPRVEATAIEAKCGGNAGSSDARIVGPENVDHVEPLYAVVSSTPNGMENRLIGARLHVRAIDGVTAESLGRALSCHEARETLVRAEDSCPYALPGAWVDIQVQSDNTGYDVALRGEDFEQARRILDRAKLFARN